MFISQGLSSRLCNVLSDPTSRDCRSCEPRVLHRYFYQVAITNVIQHLLFLSLVSSVCVCLSLSHHLSTGPSVLAMDSKSINVSNVIHVDIGCDVRFLWIFFVISIGS